MPDTFASVRCPVGKYDKIVWINIFGGDAFSIDKTGWCKRQNEGKWGSLN